MLLLPIAVPLLFSLAAYAYHYFWPGSGIHFGIDVIEAYYRSPHRAYHYGPPHSAYEIFYRRVTLPLDMYGSIPSALLGAPVRYAWPSYAVFSILIVIGTRSMTLMKLRRHLLWLPVYYLPFFLVGFLLLMQAYYSMSFGDGLGLSIYAMIGALVMGYAYMGLGFLLTPPAYIKALRDA